MASLTAPTGRTQILGAAFLLVAMAATVGTALGFQHIGGYIPCKLCYEQRIPYYAGVPLMTLALVSACAPTGGDTGSAQFNVSVPQSLEAPVSRVTVPDSTTAMTMPACECQPEKLPAG